MTETTTAKNRKQLIIIAVIAMLATVVPYIMFYTGIGVPGGTTNKGILLENPQSVADYPLQTLSGETLSLADQEPRFRLVFPVVGGCDEDCEALLYITRQVRIRLAREMDQLQRIYLNLGDPLSAEFLARLEEEHPDLVVYQGENQAWQSLLTGQPGVAGKLDGHEYFLIHRYGALVMGYNDTHTGNELLDDLKFLIKSSN